MRLKNTQKIRNMKKILLLCLTFVSYFAEAQNGLECLVLEKYYVSNANDATVNSVGGVLPVGSVTYRLYADMLPGYKFQAVYGVDVAPAGPSAGDHLLRLQTSTLFFNNEDRGDIVPSFTKARCADNTVMLDSWLSVGAACSGNYGILKSQDNGVANVVNGDGVLQNNDPSAGIPLTQQDGLIAGTPGSVTKVGIDSIAEFFNNQNNGTNGPLFATYNGSWACLGGCSGPDTTDNKVLIAQITTDGVFSYELNIQIGAPNGAVERYVAKDPVGDEISLDCLSDTLGLVVTTPPTVSITSPASGSTYTVGDSVNITASASASGANITSVEFFVDGNLIGTDNTAPYSIKWLGAFGAHDLTAKATDSNNGQATSSIITINGLVTGVDDILSSIPAFDVYPVPAQQQVTLKIKNAAIADAVVFVYDLIGNELIKQNLKSHSQTLDLSGFSAGEYLVKITANGLSSIKRILKFRP